MDEMKIKYTFKPYSTDNDVLTSVSRGDADAAVGFFSDGSDLADRFDFSYNYLYSIVKLGSFEAKNHEAFIVKKGNNDILDILNDGIDKIKENGKYAEVYKSIFGDDDSMSILTS